MPTLKLYLLGSPHLTLNDEAISIGRQKALALLCYLAVKGGPQRRDTLATLFWPEQSQQQARHALSRHLFEVKEQLGDGWLVADQQMIALPTTPDLWLDVAQFRAHLAQCAERATPCRDALTTAVALYRDDFLSGFTLPDCPEFDDWQYFQGEALRQQFATALVQLIELLTEQGEYDAALPHARRWLALDPLHEPAHRTLMQLYAQSGQAAAALRQYQRCVAILADELGAPPSVETTALYDQIRTGQYGQAELRTHDRTTAAEERAAAKPAPAEKAAQPVPSSRAAPSMPPTVRYDWREAPTIEQIYGRERERQQLTNWLVGERCRLISILGIGGLGKTTLAAQVVRDLALDDKQPFDRILWRSLLNAPPLAELLAELLHFLALPQSIVLPERLDNRLALLRNYLTQERTLLVFDNLESLMEAGARGGRFRAGYEDYSQLLHYLGQHAHQSCLLLTSREQPQEFGRLERASTAVRSLSLTGLSLQASQELLHQQGLRGEAERELALIRRYSGHPLALMLVAETIAELYFGDLAAFLAEESVIFDDIRDVLDQHFARLSPLEQEIMTWLAIEREPVTVQVLTENLLGPVNRSDYLEALRSLQRRTLLQSFPGGFGLQNVVTEYTTNRFVNQLCRELAADQLDTFNRYPLLKASAKEYLRESQRRLILNPLTERLAAQLGRTTLLRKLRAFPDQLRTTLPRGYAGGNILNWLLDLEGELVNLDLSGLTIWQAYLRGKILHDLDLNRAAFKGTLFTDTFDTIRCMTFSPNVSLLAAGSIDGQIRLWRTVDWQLVQCWQGSRAWITSIEFSPDSKTLVCGDSGGLIYLWDVADLFSSDALQPRQILDGDTGGIHSLSISPDGQLLASGDFVGGIFLWDLQSGQILQTLTGHSRLFTRVAFSPALKGRPQLLASFGADPVIHLWDIRTGQVVQTLQGHTDGVRSFCFSPDGQLLASSSFDHTIRLWDLATGQTQQIFSDSNNSPIAIRFSPDGRVLAYGSSTGTIYFRDPASGQLIQMWRGHTTWVGPICFSPSGQTLASTGSDQSIRIWDLTRPAELVSGQALQSFQGYRRGVLAVCFSPDGETLCSGDTDGLIRLWDVRCDAAQPLWVLQGHGSDVYALSFSPDGQILASGDGRGIIHLWDATAVKDMPMQILKGNGYWIRSLRFSPNGQILACADTDCTIRLWDVATGQLRQTLLSQDDYAAAVAFSPDGQILASGVGLGLIHLWDIPAASNTSVAGGQHICSFQGHTGAVNSLCFSPDGQMLISCGYDGLVQVWRWAVTLDQPERTLSGHTGHVWAVCLSPDGQILASSGQDQQIHLWDMGSGERIRTLTGHTDWVMALSFSPDGQTLASGGYDWAVKFWDVQSGRCLSTRRPDRPYERTQISGVTGLTPAQVSALKGLGALDEGP